MKCLINKALPVPRKNKANCSIFFSFKIKWYPLYKYKENDIFIRKKTRDIEIYDIKLLDLIPIKYKYMLNVAEEHILGHLQKI